MSNKTEVKKEYVCFALTLQIGKHKALTCSKVLSSLPNIFFLVDLIKVCVMYLSFSVPTMLTVRIRHYLRSCLQAAFTLDRGSPGGALINSKLHLKLHHIPYMMLNLRKRNRAPFGTQTYSIGKNREKVVGEIWSIVSVGCTVFNCIPFCCTPYYLGCYCQIGISHKS